MANKRVYELTDTQETYDKDVYVVVSDSTFTSGDKKMKVGTIYTKIDQLTAAGDFNPSSSLLRLNNGSGAENKVTVNDLLNDSDVIDIIKNLGSTGWKTYVGGDITRDSTKVDANTLVLSAIEKLGFVTITGNIKLDSQASKDESLFTLPSSIGTATQKIYFVAGDDSEQDENQEFYIDAGSRTIKATTSSGSTGREHTFCVTYPAI